jgi:hypothetical protein
MADQTIKIKITGFTYLDSDGKNTAMLNIQNVKVKGVFMWDILSEFFNNEKNIHEVEQRVLHLVHPSKEFSCEFTIELLDDGNGNLYYNILGGIEVGITGEYKFTDEENNYNEETTL